MYQPLVKMRIHQPGHLDSVSLGYRIAVCEADNFEYVTIRSFLRQVLCRLLANDVMKGSIPLKYLDYRSSICRSARSISAISPDINFPIFFRSLSFEKAWMWLVLR